MIHLSKMPFSLLCLFAAMALYALAGSPTPDDPGITEIIIGLLLVGAAGVGALRRFRRLDKTESIFLRTMHLFFLTGLSVPLIVGVFYGHAPALILRDVLAFLFLCLPLFVADIVEEDKTGRILLPLMMVLTGIVYSIRTLIPAFNIWVPEGELLYLSNSPLVLFAAIVCVCAIWVALSKLTLRSVLLSLIALLGLSVIIAAMLLDVQRATIGAIVITVLILFGLTFIRAPRQVLLPVAVTVIVGVIFYPFLMDAFEALARKTAHVGMNMRLQEVEAVFARLASDPFGLFLGTGWGGTFASPAVGLLDVNYTHSLLSTMFLKGGLLLLSVTFIMCVAALHQIFLIFQQDSQRGLMLFWPFVIPVFLYASHKSLDFGLLLLLIGVWSIQAGRLHRDQASCK
jgi:hypothetical protein